MENFKKAQVILLPTDNILQNGLQPYSVYSKPITKGGWTIPKSGAEARRLYQNGNQAYHLYIISEDKIKIGDWYYNSLYNEIYQCNNKERYRTVIYVNNKLEKVRNKKIIATTDSSLKVSKFSHYSKNLLKVPVYKDECLPQPSQQFIEHYIEAYNKSEIIKDVLVEYIKKLSDNESFSIINNPVNIKSILKINPDNTINIKLAKDS